MTIYHESLSSFLSILKDMGFNLQQWLYGLSQDNGQIKKKKREKNPRSGEVGYILM